MMKLKKKLMKQSDYEFKIAKAANKLGRSANSIKDALDTSIKQDQDLINVLTSLFDLSDKDFNEENKSAKDSKWGEKDRSDSDDAQGDEPEGYSREDWAE